MSDYKYSIEAKNVNKTFIKKTQEVKALIDFSITIKKGTIHGLLGPNGAGKSTFINILGGLVKKNSGEVNVCGINIDKNIKLSKFKIGIVPQELNIDPFFSPAELLELQAGLYGVPKKKRKTDEILENLKLTDQRNAYARTLSGGMRRRLLIGKALVHDPEIIILDEPTAGVDIDIRTSVWNYIKRISGQGKTVCLTTHYLEEAENLCDNITIINHGKKIIEGSKNDLLNIISTKSVTFVLNKNIDIPKDLKDFNAFIDNGELKLSYDKNKTNIKKIIDILNINKIDFKEGSVEDFKKLGFEDAFEISAEHNLGFEKLIKQILKHLPESETQEDINHPKITIIGKPNVGKSSLLNAISKQDLMITSPVSGTTIDAVEFEINYKGKKYRFVDTAGVKKKSKTILKEEKLSTSKSFSAIEYADLCLMVLDGSDQFNEQDLKLISKINDVGRSMIIVINKLDLFKGEEKKVLERLALMAPYLDSYPKVFLPQS